MNRGAGLVRLEMRSRERVMAGWCWVSAAAVVDSEAAMFSFGYGVYGFWDISITVGCSLRVDQEDLIVHCRLVRNMEVRNIWVAGMRRILLYIGLE